MPFICLLHDQSIELHNSTTDAIVGARTAKEMLYQREMINESGEHVSQQKFNYSSNYEIIYFPATGDGFADHSTLATDTLHY